MKKFNITTIGSYTKNGEEKKTYPQVGKLTHFEASNGKEEGYILELNMFPNTKFCVFPDTPREDRPSQPYTPRATQNQGEYTQPASRALDTIEYPQEDINPDDIPF